MSDEASAWSMVSAIYEAHAGPFRARVHQQDNGGAYWTVEYISAKGQTAVNPLTGTTATVEAAKRVALNMLAAAQYAQANANVR